MAMDLSATVPDLLPVLLALLQKAFSVCHRGKPSRRKFITSPVARRVQVIP